MKMSSLGRDFGYAVRTLRRSPGFTAAALLSLALGIGANTAIFTLTNAVFLHALPVQNHSRVRVLYTVDHATRSTSPNTGRTGISLPNIADIRAQNGVFEDVAVYTQTGVTLTGKGKPSQENAFLASNNYFAVLGVRPAAGRMFDALGDVFGAARPEVVVSHGFAQRVFGGDAAALGQALNLNSTAYTVIGVAPKEFNGTQTVAPQDAVWLPLGMHSQILNGPFERLFNERRFRFGNTLARLKPGLSAVQAEANLKTIAGRLETAYPKDNLGRTFETSSLDEAALGFVAPRGPAVTATLALTVAVGFVLMIACANLANLSLARAARRSREMGIRVALGAGRAMLVRQLMAEAALLSLGGGLLGLALGWAGAAYLWAGRPAFLQATTIHLELDARVLLFAAGLSLLSCVLFGVAPVLRASAPDVSRLLNSGGRGNVQGGGRSALRSLLVVAEIALSIVALVGSGLFVRSMQRAQGKELGFETSHLELAGLNLSSLRMTPEQGRVLLDSVLSRVRAIPGVASVAIAGSPPLNPGLVQTAFREGDPTNSRLGTLAVSQPVSPAYFETMRIPLLRGRGITPFDRADSERVAVISEAMVRQMWPGQSALGKRLRFATSPVLYSVVGVAKDSTQFNIGEAPQPVTYMPFDQVYQPFAVLHVRTVVPPDNVLPAMTSAVLGVNPELVLQNPGSVQDVIGQALWAPRFAAGLFGVFGLLGMTLAVVGVYGVMTYMVLQRTSEIGVRMAVGARPVDVVRMVLGQSMALAGAGIVVGVGAALGLTRLVADLLYDISPTDPVTFASVAGMLAATAMLAGFVPAWRASRIDPVRALRQE